MAEDKDLNAFKESHEEKVIDTSKKLRINNPSPSFQRAHN